MRKKLSAIIIDPNLREHDYSKVRTEFDKSDSIENSFDIVVWENSDNILDKLNEHKGFDALITIGKNINYVPLNEMSFEFRKKWVYLDEFNAEDIARAILSTFMVNINRDKTGSELFSIFTCTFNTSKEMLDRLYNSLCAQTYKNWNWWVLDDSTEKGTVCSFLEAYNDPRITVIKNVSNHGNIGFNKHLIASVCDGNYLVEIDHDDELTPDCLEYLKKAFDTYPDADFVYSHAFEEMDGEPVLYDDGLFALGQAHYHTHNINGKDYNIAETPDINALTLRHIVGMPNHVRCWKKEFYHRIGGHNTELSVMDDYDLLVRTFLYGKMCKVPKVLYIQHEGTVNDGDGRGSTTQGSRLPEIKRLGIILRNKYDMLVHSKLRALGVDDIIWHGSEENGYSEIIISGIELPKLNYTLEV